MADCDLFIITDPSPIMPPSSHEYCDHVTMFVGPGGHQCCYLWLWWHGLSFRPPLMTLCLVIHCSLQSLEAADFAQGGRGNVR